MKNLVIIGFVLSGSLFFAQDQFTNTGNLHLHQGTTMSVFGDLINNGTLVDSATQINLSGNHPQQIGGTALINFKNLRLNNTSGAYLSSDQKLIGVLTISAGTFSTNGHNFTLVSNANGTARIAPILGDFSGDLTMQRYIGPGPNSWRFLASPVSGGTINDWQDNFVTSGFPGSTYPTFNWVSIYTYDESVSGISDYGYNAPSSASDPIQPGVGYWCYIGPVPVTVDVSGAPTKFAHTFSVSYTPNAGLADDGFVMLGNPYPSPINWSASGWNKTNINNAIYIWNPDLQQYASWVAGTSVNGGSNLIASSQGFWIQTNGASPALSCDETVKTDGSPSFIRSQSANTLKLNLQISGNNYSDETVLLFNNNASLGYDVDADARKLFSSNSQVPGIASQDSSHYDLSINSLPQIHAAMHIPVKVKVGQSGIYILRKDTSSNIPSDICMQLEDLATSTMINVNGLNTYSFYISDTTQAARFILHVSGTGSTSAKAATCYHDQDGQAIAKGEGNGPYNYIWLNSNVSVLKQSLNVTGPDTLSHLSAGVYFVQITDQGSNCGSFTKTVNIAEPAPVIASFQLNSTELILEMNDSLIIQNNSSGAQSYVWNFGDGSAIETSPTPLSHHYNNEGVYRVSLTAKYSACEDSTFKLVRVRSNSSNAISEESMLASDHRVYPNPSNGIFYLSIPSEVLLNASLTVINAEGNLMMESKIHSNITLINLEGQAKGIYFYTIRSENKRISGKLIVN